MALSNRDRIDRMFQVLAPALDDFISTVVGQGDPALGAVWTKLVQAKDSKNGAPSTKTYDPLDPQVQFRILTEGNITAGFKPGWYPFNQAIGRAGETFASELREVRNKWAHNGTFTDDDAYRALDTGERLLKLIGAAKEADEVRGDPAEPAPGDRRQGRQEGPQGGRRQPRGRRASSPWREVLQPHDDVATGNFHASEFAADLYKVATGGEVDADYADPVEFFTRTYLTEGLRDLIGRAVRRLAGDDNASPVINLQTNFGGGKTHSMLSLWHVAAGLPVGEFPQETQELLTANGYTGTKVNRVAIVGNHFSPSGVTKDDGTQVNTIWGELAWQLGGAEAYALVAKADRDRTHPGDALHELLAEVRARRHPDRRVGRLRPLARRPRRPGRRHVRRPVHLRPVADRGCQGHHGCPARDLDPGLGERRRRRQDRRRQRRGGRRRERTRGAQAAPERRAPRRRPVAPRVVRRGVPHRQAAAVQAARRRRARGDRRDGQGVRRDVPQVHRRLPARGSRLGVRGPHQADLPDPPGAVRHPLRGVVVARAVPAHPRCAAPDEHRHPRAVDR